MYWPHAEKHKAINTNTLISALSANTTELPLTRCSHTGPPMEMTLLDEAGNKGKDSKQREGGYISIPVPQGVDN